MWKYVSRRIRDTFERSANYFDVRSTTGVANAPNNNNFNGSEKKKSSAPCCWYCPRKCWTSFQGNNNTHNKRNFEHLNYSWLGAITWSSGLVLAWYASNLLHLKSKKRLDERRLKLHEFYSSLRPYVKDFKCKQFLLQSPPNVERVAQKLGPTVHEVSNDHDEPSQRKRATSSSGSVDSAGSDDLGDVLNSIENRLGLSAIENGQHKDGLNLLRSAANRNHAPALYNLGLCYELGLGVKSDEKMAMELYRSAASLDHAGAMYNLGIYYAQGRGGLPRDTNTATRLLRLAAVKGQQDAVKALNDLNIQPVEEKKPAPSVWAYSYMPYERDDNNIVPIQSSLFVDNKTFLHARNCETTIY